VAPDRSGPLIAFLPLTSHCFCSHSHLESRPPQGNPILTNLSFDNPAIPVPVGSSRFAHSALAVVRLIDALNDAPKKSPW